MEHAPQSRCARDRQARARLLWSGPAVSIGSSTCRVTLPGQVARRPFSITNRASDRSPPARSAARLDRQQKIPPLKRPTRPSTLRVPFGKDDQRVAGAHQRPDLLEHARARILTRDEHVPGPREVPAEERESAQRILGEDAQLERQVPEQHRNVVDALMIRDEQGTLVARHALDAARRDLDAGRRQNQPRPHPRASMREAAARDEERLDASDSVPRTIV